MERRFRDEKGHEHSAPERRAPESPPALRLAATIGNQAFCRAMVQRNGDPPVAVKPTPEQLSKDFDTAASAGKWEDAAKLLIQLPEATITAKIKGLTELERVWLGEGAETALPAVQAATIARHLSFVAHRPADKAAKPDTMQVITPGAEQHKASVGGGEVSVRAGGDTKNLGSGLRSGERFSMGYKGPQAEKTRWLQFIWREIEVEHDVRGTFKVDQPITTTGGTYGLTTDPSKPKYNTDSHSASSPFYEEAFTANRTADSTTMFDLPSPMQNVVDRQFDEGAKKVVSRAHFTTYLVRDMDVLYKIEFDVEWVFTAKGAAPPRKQGVKSAGAAASLDAEQRKRLVAQYPNFDYLP